VELTKLDSYKGDAGSDEYIEKLLEKNKD
jgi:hypothetical protein